MTHASKNIGPYTWVSRDEHRGRYRIALYGAFNAYGLIGSEHNGIAVFDDEDKRVVADQLFQADSGYFGPSWDQQKGFDTLMKCSPKEFAAIINNSGRNRYEISASSVAKA
jgi:hypothetical protein